MSLNLELLAQIREVILREPLCLNMYNWVSAIPTRNPYKDVGHHVNHNTRQPIPSCGTVGCIAGWACFLDKAKTQVPAAWEEDWYESWNDKGLELLGIEDGKEGDALFYTEKWPKEYQDRYEGVDTPENRAQVTADLLASVIEQGRIWWYTLRQRT